MMKFNMHGTGGREPPRTIGSGPGPPMKAKSGPDPPKARSPSIELGIEMSEITKGVGDYRRMTTTSGLDPPNVIERQKYPP